MAKIVVYVFAPRRGAVFHLILLWQNGLNRLCCQPAGAIVVEVEGNSFDMRVVLQILGKGCGQLAFLNHFFRLIHTGQREKIKLPPVAAELFV